jgi:hypothetical protein
MFTDFVFDDINDAYFEILQIIYDKGQLKGKRKEVPFLTFTLTDLDKNVLFFPFSQRNWPWILRECSDRIFGVKNPGTSFQYSKNWKNRIEDSGLYSYHYSDRLNGQMEKLLSSKVHSRDKIIHVWEKDDYHSKSRQPCTIIMQPFTEADNRLSMIVYMRNNDMINIFPSDIFIHSTYLKYWAVKRNLAYGNIYWVSAIAYYQKKRDRLKFVERLLQQWSLNYRKANIAPVKWNHEFYSDFAKKEILEKQLRDGLNIDLENIQTPYIKEWLKIMLLYHLKKDKDEFKKIYDSTWLTEFGLLKDSIIPFK